MIGTVQQYPDAQAVRAMTSALLAQVNADSSHNDMRLHGIALAAINRGLAF